MGGAGGTGGLMGAGGGIGPKMGVITTAAALLSTHGLRSDIQKQRSCIRIHRNRGQTKGTWRAGSMHSALF
eukprot:1158261-Pelagomonas_calceolata.AAC.6